MIDPAVCVGSQPPLLASAVTYSPASSAVGGTSINTNTNNNSNAIFPELQMNWGRTGRGGAEDAAAAAASFGTQPNSNSSSSAAAATAASVLPSLRARAESLNFHATETMELTFLGTGSRQPTRTR